MRKPRGIRKAFICDCGGHGFVGLTRAGVALFSPEDHHLIDGLLWCQSYGYATRTVYRNGKKIEQKMHRRILDAGPDDCVDHKNRDRSDNRRENIRICDRSKNMMNRGAWGVISPKGVSLTKEGRYRARIQFEGRPVTIGTFETAEDAATAYRRVARILHGEFASEPRRFSEPMGDEAA